MIPHTNTYWVLRHGRSLANEAAIIVSDPENGVKPEYGLAETGKQQAAAAGLLFQQELTRLGVPADAVHIYTSPFSRTVQSAQIAVEAAGLNQEVIKVNPLLRERFFGARVELQSHDNYCLAWEGDALNPAGKPAGNLDGESVTEVSARIKQLFQANRLAETQIAGTGYGQVKNHELEQQHLGQHILLVSHGDTLSILQATFYGSPLTQHRQYGLGTAELKQLGSCTREKLDEQQADKTEPAAAVIVAATANS